MKQILYITICLICMCPQITMAKPHPKVHAALEWELPTNDCNKPRVLKYKVSDSLGTASSRNAPVSFDVDHYQIEAYERKKKRWAKCEAVYRNRRLSDFVELKSSAQYGLTRPQVDSILEKLALIQSVLSPSDAIGG